MKRRSGPDLLKSLKKKQARNKIVLRYKRQGGVKSILPFIMWSQSLLDTEYKTKYTRFGIIHARQQRKDIKIHDRKLYSISYK